MRVGRKEIGERRRVREERRDAKMQKDITDRSLLSKMRARTIIAGLCFIVMEGASRHGPPPHPSTCVPTSRQYTVELIPSHDLTLEKSKDLRTSIGILSALTDTYLETHQRLRINPGTTELDLEHQLRASLLVNKMLHGIIEKDVSMKRNDRDAYITHLEGQERIVNEYLGGLRDGRERSRNRISNTSMRY